MTDCWTALGLQAANPGSFNDTETTLDAAAAAAKTAWDIADIGYTLLLLDGFYIPVLGFISLGFDIVSIIGLFGGRPQFEDTNNVIWAYNMSAYWPLHALASDLKIAEKNGAPISDSNPAIQAQFSAWKQGTIVSIQQVAGWQGGPSDPGYWQLQRLIDYSWAQSGGGQQAVLNVVRVIDRLTQILACLQQQQATKPPPPPPGPPGGPPPPPPPGPALCDSGNPDQDEILDFCNATQTSLQQILAAIQALNRPGGGGTIDPCCAAVVNAIGNVTAQLANITAILLGAGGTSQTIDLGPITLALQDLATAAAQYPPIITALKDCVCTNLGAIATSLGPDLGKVIQNIADAINNSNADDLLPAAMVDEMVKNGSMPAPIAQFFSARPASWSIAGLISGIGSFLFGGMNPNLGAEIAANINAVKAGQAPPYHPIHSLIDVPMYLLAFIGSYWTTWAVGLAGVALPAAQSAIQQIGTVVINQIPGGAPGLPVGVGAPAIAALQYVESAPPPGMKITTGNYQTVVQDAMGRAGLMGMTAWGAAMVGGFLLGPWEKYWGEVAAMIATAAGFEEISARALGPFLDAIIRNRAIQDANQKWPTRVPPAPQGLALWARRKITDPERDLLLDYGGLDPTWRPGMEHGAFRPVQPRVIVNAFLDQPINRANLVAMLEDAALSPANVQLMADAIIYKSDANVRNSYLSALVSGYGKGVVSDVELDNVLTQFNFSTQAKQYVKSHVLILRREVLAAEAEKTIVPMVANGNLLPAVGLQQLEAAGIEPWYAQLQITLATTRATIHGIKLAAEAARHLAIAREREAQRAAIAQFEDGTVNAAGLSAALLLAGIDPLIAGMVVSVETAKQAGRMQVVYNQLLPPLQAKLLREQVAAIEQQTKDQLITLAQAATQLQALGIDQAETQALVARWAATLKKGPGASVYLTP